MPFLSAFKNLAYPFTKPVSNAGLVHLTRLKIILNRLNLMFFSRKHCRTSARS